MNRRGCLACLQGAFFNGVNEILLDQTERSAFIDKYIGWKPVTLVMGGKPSLKHLRRFFFCLFPFLDFHTSILYN